jgi:ribokinase
VDTSLLRAVYGTSGVALILVDGDGENAIVVAPGANAALTSLSEADLAAIGLADVLLLQLEIPIATVTAAAVAARQAGVRVLLNAAPAGVLPAELTEVVDLLVVNHVEGTALAGVTPVGVDAIPDPSGADPWLLVEALLERFPEVVVTRGATGAWYGSRTAQPVHVPAPVIEAVDTTGAGDAFTAALAVAWGEGRDLIDAVRWASAAGAAAARRPGTSNALPGRADIHDLYSSTYHR